MTDGVSEEQGGKKQNKTKHSTIATMAKIIKPTISGLLVKVPLNSKLHTDKLVYL